jgi:hypothetical protein
VKEQASFQRIAFLFWSWLLLAPGLLLACLYFSFKHHGWSDATGIGLLNTYRVFASALPYWGFIHLIGAVLGVRAMFSPKRLPMQKAWVPVLMNLAFSGIWVLSLISLHRGEWNFYSW